MTKRLNKREVDVCALAQKSSASSAGRTNFRIALCVGLAAALLGPASAETILDESVPGSAHELGYLVREAEPSFGFSVSGLGGVGGRVLVGSPLSQPAGMSALWEVLHGEVIKHRLNAPGEPEARDGHAVGVAGGRGEPGIHSTIVGTPGWLDWDCPEGAAYGWLRARNFYVSGTRCGRLGDAVSGIGDVTGDGVGDVLMSEPLANRAYVLTSPDNFGDSDAPFSDPAIGFNIVGIPVSAPHPRSMDVAGVGDVNGDGVSDFAVAAMNTPIALAGGRTAYGAVYVFRGREADWPLNVNANSAVRLFDSATPANGYAKRIAGVGDLDGDGHGDIAITTAYQRELFLVLGSPALASMDLSTMPPGVVRIILPPSLPAAQIRDVSGAGDVDGDGFADLVFGAHVPPPVNRGVVCMVPGRPDLVNTAVYDLSESDKVTCVLGPLSHGNSVGAAGDISRDGRPEWLAGIPNYDARNSVGGVMAYDSQRVANLADWGNFPSRATYRRAVLPKVCTAALPDSGVGVLGDQQDAKTPSSRLSLDLCRTDALAPRPVAGRVAVTLNRSQPAPLNLARERFARVHWQVQWQLSEQPRVQSAQVELDYTRAEVAGLNQQTLQVVRLDPQRGGWVPADLNHVDVVAGRIFATIPTSSTQFLALVGAARPEADLEARLDEVEPPSTYSYGDRVRLRWQFTNLSEDTTSSAELIATTERITFGRAARWTCTASSAELCPPLNDAVYLGEDFRMTRTLLPGQFVILALDARVGHGPGSIHAVGVVSHRPEAPRDSHADNDFVAIERPIVPNPPGFSRD